MPLQEATIRSPTITVGYGKKWLLLAGTFRFGDRCRCPPGARFYILALVLLSSSHLRTLPLGIAVLQFVQFYEVDFGALFAGLVIVMLPTLVCYIVLQEQITKGITVGAVKG